MKLLYTIGETFAWKLPLAARDMPGIGHHRPGTCLLPVIPAQAGIQRWMNKRRTPQWIPACAGMTNQKNAGMNNQKNVGMTNQKKVAMTL